MLYVPSAQVSSAFASTAKACKCITLSNNLDALLKILIHYFTVGILHFKICSIFDSHRILMLRALL